MPNTDTKVTIELTPIELAALSDHLAWRDRPKEAPLTPDQHRALTRVFTKLQEAELAR